MRARYDRERDVLTLQLAEGMVDHARQVGEIVVHFTEDDRPLLLEMLGARELLARLNGIAVYDSTGEPVTI